MPTTDCSGLRGAGHVAPTTAWVTRQHSNICTSAPEHMASKRDAAIWNTPSGAEEHRYSFGWPNSERVTVWNAPQKHNIKPRLQIVLTLGSHRQSIDVKPLGGSEICVQWELNSRRCTALLRQTVDQDIEQQVRQDSPLSNFWIFTGFRRVLTQTHLGLCVSGETGAEMTQRPTMMCQTLSGCPRNPRMCGRRSGSGGRSPSNPRECPRPTDSYPPGLRNWHEMTRENTSMHHVLTHLETAWCTGNGTEITRSEARRHVDRSRSWNSSITKAIFSIRRIRNLKKDAVKITFSKLCGPPQIIHLSSWPFVFLQ